MIAEVEKPNIRLWEEAKQLVENNVYLCMTYWVDYITKQDDFWNDNPDCPITYSDLEYKPCKKYERDEDDDRDYGYDDYYEDKPFDYMEAYAVSDWLADELYERGEWVARFQMLPCIWFRNTSGQMIACDEVIHEITRDWLVRIGRCTQEEADALSYCD